MRDFAFKLIYSIEFQKEDNIDELIEIYIKNNNLVNKEAIEYIKDCVYGIGNNKKEIDKTIEESLSSEWHIDRISKLNLSLLKLAIYEIKYKNIPYKVEINEVIELSKKYDEEKSSKFINGALAKVVKDM